MQFCGIRYQSVYTAHYCLEDINTSKLFASPGKKISKVVKPEKKSIKKLDFR